MKRAAIFVDVQNVYYTTRQAYSAHFDYNAFWKVATADRSIIAATAFAIDRADAKQRQFQNILRGIGFDVKLKPYISRADGTSKGDWDVGITIDILERAKDCDVVVLASGDGDFDVLVQYVRERFSIDFEMYGVPQLTAGSLNAAATRFVPIDESLLLRSRPE